jgi:NitT/TauT family transport system substrate-binding protein
MEHKMKSIPCIIFSLALLFVLVACSPSPDASSPDVIRVQLKWVHQAQFAGIYVAQNQGYYTDENVEISLVEGGPGINVMGNLLSGEVDVAVDSPINIILARAAGESVIGVSTIYRINPSVFVSMPGSQIASPYDFIGKSVAAQNSSDYEIQIQALAEKLNLELAEIDLVPHVYDLSPLYTGELDVVGVYAIGGLIRAKMDGHELDVIWPGDYGIHTYADTLVTTEAFVQQNSDLLVRFLRATLRGWRKAVEDPELATGEVMKFAFDADLETQRQMMLASVPLVHTGKDQIGWMEPDIWNGTVKMLIEQGILIEPLAASEVYSMDFLYQIYGKD